MANLYNPSNIGNLDPDDYNAFQTRRRQAYSGYQQSKDQNAYRRTNAGLGLATGQRDLRQQYSKARGAFGSEFTQKGLLNSGLYRKAYKDLRTDRASGYADLTSQYNQLISGLRISDRQLLDTRTNSLNDTDSAQAARVASVAAALKYAKENG